MVLPKNAAANSLPELYHAPSSYFSMIARLAIAEAGIGYRPIFIDIHYRSSQQSPAYARLNPHMTVPTLAFSGSVICQSREILELSAREANQKLNDEVISWIDLHYKFPVEELTFGRLLAHNPLARALIPARLASARRRLLRQASLCPDLAAAYEARAAVFAEREQTFDPNSAVRLAAMRRREAINLLDRLEKQIRDGRAVIVPPSYSAADVVWTVFLARMQFVGLGNEILTRPNICRYWAAMVERRSFKTADIWTKMDLGRLIGGVFQERRQNAARR